MEIFDKQGTFLNNIDTIRDSNDLFTNRAYYSELLSSLNFCYNEFSGYVETFETTQRYAPAYALKKVIAKFYYLLRNLALIGSLLVLLYCGIKIIISSASKDKAKYKSILIDWLIGLCILIFMHFIMVFMVNMVEKIIELICQYFNPLDVSDFCNIIRKNATVDDIEEGLGYTVIYITLIVLVITYTFTYFKRIIYMAFLTIIAPLVAFSYPIDKLKDGQAQAFNMWIKEYIFNLLIQPMHLILYTVIIGSVKDLATSSMLYAIVALAFISQAEKIVRKFFGFEKAETPGFLNGPAGGALAMEGFRKLTGWGPGHNKNNANKSNSNSSSDEISLENQNFKQINAYESMFDKYNDNDKNKNSYSTNNFPNSSLLGNGNSTVNGIQPDVSSSTASLTSTQTPNFSNSRHSMPLNNNTSASPSLNNNFSNSAKRSRLRAWKRLGRTALNNHSPIKTLGKASKFTLKSIGGISGGMMGLGIGIATGSPKQALQYSILGAKGGQNLSGNLADKVSSGATNIASKYKTASETWNEGYYTQEEYTNKIRQKQFKELAKNKDLRNKLELNVPNIKLKEALKEGGDVQQFTDAGMDINQIIASLNFKNNHSEFTTDQVISSMKIADEIRDKDIDKQRKILYENFKYHNKNISDDQLNDMVDQQLGYSKELEKYRKKVK